MFRLTEDMTRLRADIGALRDAREMLVDSLVRGVKGLRNTISETQGRLRKAHAGMARKERGNRMAAIKGIQRASLQTRRAASQAQAGFRDAFADTAKEARADRAAFTKGLKDTVWDAQSGFRDAFGAAFGETKGNVSASVTNVRNAVHELKVSVAGLRSDFAKDIAGAHQAFFGEACFGSKPDVQMKPEKGEEEDPAKEKKPPKAPGRGGKTKRAAKKG